MNSGRDHAEAWGFPIRKSPDQSLLSNSPKHIAACHVLHRLLVPRHPPNALSSLFLTPAPYLIRSSMESIPGLKESLERISATLSVTGFQIALKSSVIFQL